MNGKLRRTQSSVHKEISLLREKKWTKREAKKWCHSGTDDSFNANVQKEKRPTNQLVMKAI
jgi:hypothetical protein